MISLPIITLFMFIFLITIIFLLLFFKSSIASTILSVLFVSLLMQPWKCGIYGKGHPREIRQLCPGHVRRTILHSWFSIFSPQFLAFFWTFYRFKLWFDLKAYSTVCHCLNTMSNVVYICLYFFSGPCLKCALSMRRQSIRQRDDQQNTTKAM